MDSLPINSWNVRIEPSGGRSRPGRLAGWQRRAEPAARLCLLAFFWRIMIVGPVEVTQPLPGSWPPSPCAYTLTNLSLHPLSSLPALYTFPHLYLGLPPPTPLPAPTPSPPPLPLIKRSLPSRLSSQPPLISILLLFHSPSPFITLSIHIISNKILSKANS